MRLCNIVDTVAEATAGHSQTLPLSGQNPSNVEALQQLATLRQNARNAQTNPDDRVATLEAQFKTLVHGYIELKSDLIRGFAQQNDRFRQIMHRLSQIAGDDSNILHGTDGGGESVLS